MSNPGVAILLPTFNGEKYLAEQLDSLVCQSYQNLIIVIRDDGSSDGTLKVIHSYQARFPDKFHTIENDGRNLGACNSYSFLMNYAVAHKEELGLKKAYMMFCDQDDIWIKKKVELEMQTMETAEAEGADIPVLVHSDLKVVSESGALIAESFLRYQGLHPAKNKFRQLLFCNLVTGCTALINEPLATRSLPIPEKAIMHDWWLALVASAFGRLVLIHQPLVEYRQHGSNTYGAREKATSHSLMELLRKIRQVKPDPLIKEQTIQAKTFLTQFRSQLGMGQKISIRLTSSLLISSGVGQRVAKKLGRRF